MLQKLRSFLILAELKSINRASTRLHISQSSLSRQLLNLERELDTILFIRSPQGLLLTPAGQLLYNTLPQHLEKFDLLLSDARNLGRGHREDLRISSSSSSTHYVNAAIQVFQKKYPKIKLHLHYSNQSEQVASLKEGRSDIALLYSERNTLGDDYYIINLVSLDSFAALPLTHELSKRTSLEMKDLQPYPFLNYSEKWAGSLNEWFTKLCRKSGFKPLIQKYVCHSFQKHLSLIVSEELITLVPVGIQTFPSMGITLIPVTDAKAAWELNVVWQRDKKSPAIQYFVTALKAAAQEKTINAQL